MAVSIELMMIELNGSLVDIKKDAYSIFFYIYIPVATNS